MTASTATLRPEPEKPTLPGRCARTYQLERLLGRGAYGQVWRALHRDLGRSVALKILTPDASVEDGTATARLHNEARVTAMLKHPNVVQVLDHDVEDGMAWIAYEDLGGGTVLDRVRRGKMDWMSVAEMGRQVAGALAEAHSHDVLHRDVKADNILESAPGAYKLVDFGLAGGVRTGNFQTADRMVVGTPAYLAPETLRGAPASPASDQFALGIVLYFCLTGVLPHHDPRDVQKTVLARVSQSVPPPSELVPSLPPRVDAVIARMVAKDPGERFASLDEVKLALGMALRRQTSGVVARPASRASSSLKGSPLRRSLKVGVRSIHDAVAAWSGRSADPHATPRPAPALAGARRAVAAFALGASLAVSLGVALLVGPAARFLEPPVEPAPVVRVAAGSHAAIE